MPVLKSLTIDGTKFDLPEGVDVSSKADLVDGKVPQSQLPSPVVLTITNPTFTYNSTTQSNEYVISETQFNNNDIIVINLDEDFEVGQAYSRYIVVIPYHSKKMDVYYYSSYLNNSIVAGLRTTNANLKLANIGFFPNTSIDAMLVFPFNSSNYIYTIPTEEMSDSFSLSYKGDIISYTFNSFNFYNVV
jgi:hypothetical protein